MVLESRVNRSYSEVGELLSKPKVIIFVRGIPGSGKSCLSQKVKDQMPRDYVVLVDPDSVDKNSIDYSDFVENLKKKHPDLDPKVFLYRYLLCLVREKLLEEKLIIWNQPFSDLENLDYTITKVKSFVPEGRRLNILVVDIEVDKEEARQRVKKRKEEGGHGPDDKYFDKLVCSFQKAESLGYDYLCVKSEPGMDLPLREILKRMEYYGL